MEINLRLGSKKVVIHESSILTKHTLKNNNVLMQWENCYKGNFTDKNLHDLIKTSKNNKVLPLDHGLETGIYLISLKDNEYLLYSDPGIPTSLYYAVKDGTVYLANTDKKVSELISDSPDLDFAGVYQRLIFGSTFGPRTRYKDVFVLEPGSTVSINSGGNIERKKLYYQHMNIKLDDIWEALGEEIRKIENDKIGIMLSAGYDSRVLLAACLDQKRQIDMAYTHGLIGSTELNIAYELAKTAGARAVVQMDAGSKMFGSAEEIHDLFSDIGILYQVFWRLAGEIFAAEGITPICGVQAEILNGQYMNGLVWGSLTRLRKYLIGKRGYSKYIDSSKSFSEFVMNSVNTNILSFIKPDLKKIFEEGKEVTKNDLILLAESYQSVCRNWTDIVIRFLSDHDGSKLMVQQARMLRKYCPISAPFTSRKVYMLSNAYLHKEKIYGEPMRKLLCKHSHVLSKYNCTKSNLPLYFPISFHILGRTIRSYFDKDMIYKFLESKGEKRKYLNRFSWVGGDVWIRDNNALREIKSLITGKILNIDRIDEYIEKIDSYQIAVGDGNNLMKVIELDLL